MKYEKAMQRESLCIAFFNGRVYFVLYLMIMNAYNMYSKYLSYVDYLNY